MANAMSATKNALEVLGLVCFFTKSACSIHGSFMVSWKESLESKTASVDATGQVIWNQIATRFTVE